MSGSLSMEQLLQRLARLEIALAERDELIAERDARIEVLASG
ncbi:hypothetical protein AB0H83_14395 [Dactylosporangium sp. NPDC050688]